MLKQRNLNIAATPGGIPIIADTDILGQVKSNRMGFIRKIRHGIVHPPELDVTYAGLGRRSLAKLIDLAVLFIPLFVLEKLLFNFDFQNGDYNTFRLLIVASLWIIYNGLYESSFYQATIGKMFLGIQVVDLNGRRIGFLRSVARCISIFLSIFPMGFGIWYITTDSRKRSWHDLVAGTYVIKTNR